MSGFQQRIQLGRTGLQVSRIGLASSYGVDADGVQEAYEKGGINYFYWGSRRREDFGEGIRRLARRNREDLVVVIQTYSRFTSWMRRSLESALRRLGLEYADILLLGYFNQPPSVRLLETALDLRRRGRCHSLAVSCHRRSSFASLEGLGAFDALMFRYNAAHRGAEKDVLPLFEREGRPGAIAYTATRWGTLMDPKRMPAGERNPRASDCYRFVLSHPQVDLCLAGPASREEMLAALDALERGSMSEEELAWMRRIGDHIYRNRRRLLA